MMPVKDPGSSPVIVSSVDLMDRFQKYSEGTKVTTSGAGWLEAVPEINTRPPAFEAVFTVCSPNHRVYIFFMRENFYFLLFGGSGRSKAGLTQ